MVFERKKKSTIKHKCHLNTHLTHSECTDLKRPNIDKNGGIMFQDMKGKVAIVTGATSGIGRASSVLLAQQGVKVVLAGRNEQSGQTLEQDIISFGGEAVFVRTDVSDAKSVENLMVQAQAVFGTIHYALNNAGIEGKLGALSEMEEQNFDEVISINLRGVWLCLKYQLQAMASQGGSVVNISTRITRIGMVGTGVYTASKAGVESLTRVAAIEHGKQGIRVNAVSPGAVDTPMIHRIYPDQKDVLALSKRNPMGKIASPEDIANTVLWLFSSMSAHVNGDVIFVDGGSSIAG
jgi:NAD(P)-dependent dehydrogenase (short-subunit alcohol dehydrogenase family)